MEFSDKLKKELKEQKVTAYALAKAIGVNKQSIYNYINGKQEPNVSMLRKICLSLDVSADYLLDLKEY